MKKIIAISGSLRRDSYNTKLLKKLELILKDKTDYEIIDISNIPLFNEDLENIEVPKIVTSLKSKINDCDLVIVSTPEYNYSISGVLKNALDWFSRGADAPFDGKDIVILSASMSRFGGVRAQLHLRQVLLCLGANVFNNYEVFVSNAHETIDSEEANKHLEKLSNIILNKLKEK